MRALLRIAAGIDRLNRAIGKVVAWLTLLMILIGAMNAILRYLDSYTGGGLSSNAFIEAQWFLFSLVFLLGAAYTLRGDGHVRVDVLYGRLSERGKAWIDLFGGVLFLLPFCVFALWVGWPFFVRSLEAREGSMDLFLQGPLRYLRSGHGEISPDPGGLLFWPLKFAILAGFALLALQGLSEIVKRAAFLGGLSAEQVGLHEPRPYAGASDVERA